LSQTLHYGGVRWSETEATPNEYFDEMMLKKILKVLVCPERMHRFGTSEGRYILKGAAG